MGSNVFAVSHTSSYVWKYQFFPIKFVKMVLASEKNQFFQYFLKLLFWKTGFILQFCQVWSKTNANYRIYKTWITILPYHYGNLQAYLFDFSLIYQSTDNSSPLIPEKPKFSYIWTWFITEIINYKNNLKHLPGYWRFTLG